MMVTRTSPKSMSSSATAILGESSSIEATISHSRPSCSWASLTIAFWKSRAITITTRVDATTAIRVSTVKTRRWRDWLVLPSPPMSAPQAVAHAADRLDHIGVLAELGAQLLHMHVHGARTAIEIPAPDALEQLLAGEDLAR